MNDSDDPNDLESLEKHIKLDWDEKPASQATPISSSPFEPTFEKPSAPPFETGPVKQFYLDLLSCLTEPSLFFQQRYPKISLSYAITFGIVVNWIASFLDWLTRAVRHETLLDGFMRMRDKLQGLPMWKNLPDNFWAQGAPAEHATSGGLFPAWIAEMLSIALSPFQSLIRFCIFGFVLFLGACFLISKKENTDQDPIDISHFVKLVCITSAPCLVASILGFLPLGFGSLVGWVYSVTLMILGMGIRYRISSLRAVVVMILPGIVAIFMLSGVLIVFAGLLFALFASLFH